MVILNGKSKKVYKERSSDYKGQMSSKYYIITLPASKHVLSTNVLPEGVQYMKGQLEQGEGGLLHWQFIVYLKKKSRSAAVRKLYPGGHVELTRSAAAEEYVWKEDTRIPDTQFEIGKKSLKRNSPVDWDNVWESAKKGKLDDIPADIKIRCYSNLKRIHQDHLKPEALEKEVKVFIGPTGTGKSRRAWEEAGPEAYPKDPRSKFWDGYRGQKNVVIDEFRGSIDIAHLLRWLDRYPVNVEVKGSSTALAARKVWITSNIPPREWYPEVDQETFQALLRRFEVEIFN